MRLDPAIIKQQIENLKLQYPEIAEDSEAWLISLESETEVDSFLTNVVRQIEDNKALEEGTESRLEELKARKKRFQDRQLSYRAMIFSIMQTMDIQKKELPEATLSLRKNQPQLIGDADPESVAPEFRKITVTIDKTAIKEALKTGQTVPGFQLSNAPPSLTIRTT